mgnify:FL=1
MKKIVFAKSNINHNEYVYPYMHDDIAQKNNKTRPMFIPDYHAPLDKVYQDNGYQVVHKSIKKAYIESDEEPFIYLISPQPNIFALFTEQYTKLKSYFTNIDPMIIECVNEGRCAFVVHNCKEQYEGDTQVENDLHNFFIDCGFTDPRKIIMLETSQNADTSNCFNFVKWNYFETAVRLMKFNIGLDQKFKSNYKKFLCLNFTPRYHRRDFMYAMQDYNLLDQFNASHNDKKLPLTYDVDDHNVHLSKQKDLKIKPSSGHIPMLVKDVNHWNTLHDRLTTENLINIVTETPFQNKDLLFITEKTFKPIILKMPFIILGNGGTLRYLHSLGFKTFGHMWSEEYDLIFDKEKRMAEICKVVKNIAMLPNKHVRNLVEKNYDILEHNYNLLMQRRPENVVFDAVENTISRL